MMLDSRRVDACSTSSLVRYASCLWSSETRALVLARKTCAYGHGGGMGGDIVAGYLHRVGASREDDLCGVTPVVE